MAHLSEKQGQILRQLQAPRIDEDQNGRKQGGFSPSTADHRFLSRATSGHSYDSFVLKAIFGLYCKYDLKKAKVT
jgi:hypothetical protein